jgi:SAM-dependent methyltransferase
LDTQVLREQMRGIVERYGEWTDHDIHIVDDLFTIGAGSPPIRLGRIMQIVADLAGRPLSELRVLDLACLEGLYAVELARRGAQVVAIEGREANLAKVRFVKDALGLENLTLYQDDVRNLCPETYGEFDVVLCLGILYHLDVPDVFRFVESIGRVTRRLAVFDTYVSVACDETHEHSGRRYGGRSYEEHAPDDSPETRMRRLWSSLDNPRSFWPTRASLYNLLTACGFTTLYECHVPADLEKPADRLTLVALRGERQPLLSAACPEGCAEAEWPERLRRRLSPNQDPRQRLAKRLSRMVPAALKRPAKAALRSVGLYQEAPLWQPIKGRRRPPTPPR